MRWTDSQARVLGFTMIAGGAFLFIRQGIASGWSFAEWIGFAWGAIFLSLGYFVAGRTVE